jgi:thiol-disulfide isomerase/thioredoxin
VKKGRWFLEFLVLASFLEVAACRSTPATDETPSSLAAPFAVSPAPDFSLPNLSGQTVSLSPLRGRPVLVDFWATWCPPCRESIPALARVYEAYKGRGLHVLGINVDGGDGMPVAEFVRKRKIPYTVLLAGENSTPNDYGVEGIPAIFLVSPSGKIVNRWVGFTPDMEQEWMKSVEEVLASPS